MSLTRSLASDALTNATKIVKYIKVLLADLLWSFSAPQSPSRIKSGRIGTGKMERNGKGEETGRGERKMRRGKGLSLIHI